MVREWGRPGGWEELHSSHVITLNQPVTQVVTQKSQPSHNLSQHFSSYLCSTKNMIWSRSINPKTDTGVGDLGQNFFHPKFTRLGCFLSFASLFSFNVTLSIPSGCPVSDNDCRSDSDGAFFDFSRHSETHHHFHWAPQRMRCTIFTSWLTDDENWDCGDATFWKLAFLHFIRPALESNHLCALTAQWGNIFTQLQSDTLESWGVRHFTRGEWRCNICYW